MADDDDQRGPAPDPWDEIVADGLGEDFSAETLQFEAADAESTTPVEPLPPGDTGAESDDVAAESVRDDDAADVEEWLTDDDDAVDAGSPVLSVFAPEEPAAGLSAVDIGTGTSGIQDDGEPEPVQDMMGGDTFPGLSDTGAVDVDEWAGVDPATAATAAEDGTEGTFDPAADVATAAGAAAPAVIPAISRRARKPGGKSRGIGQLVGVVLGGLLAIPATLAILLFGFGHDPLGVARLVPASLRPRAPQPPAAVVAAPVDPAPVDAEPAVPEPAEVAVDAAVPMADEPLPVADVPAPVADVPMPAPPADMAAVDDVPVVSEPAVSEPVVVPGDGGMPVADEPVPAAPPDMARAEGVATVEPQPEPEPVPMPEPQPPLDAVAVDAPGLDALVTEPPVVPPPAPPQQPLDTAALDEAVGEAAALGEALGAVADRGNRAYTLLRTQWYRSLARVAEELVALEHAAAVSGRPLDGAPDNVVLLHGTIGSRAALAAELAALAPDWLAYAKRGSDGVVLPVTFGSARKVGPYWTTRATLTAADGTPRTVTVVSRTEPAGAAGERLVVTGVAIDGGVIWAADVRGAPADGDAAPGF